MRGWLSLALEWQGSITIVIEKLENSSNSRIIHIELMKPLQKIANYYLNIYV